MDGAGTTTQLDLIERKLIALKLPHYCTGEPTNGRLGLLLRDILSSDFIVHPLTVALLFAADRTEHLEDPEDGIRARLRQGELIVSDRYLFSSLAYQGVSCGFEPVFALNRAFPLPSHLFFIDTPLCECQKRIDERGRIDLYDAPTMQEQVRDGYQRAFELLNNTSMVIHQIDGEQSSRLIFNAIWSVIADLPIIKR